MSDEIADVLDAAADEIEKRGLARGMLIDGAGRVCSIGAIFRALNVPFTAHEQRYRAEPVIKSLVKSIGLLETGNLSLELAYWSDQWGRSDQEVLDAFRLAAKEERMG